MPTKQPKTKSNTMNADTLTYLTHLAKDLEQAKHGQKSYVINKAAKFLSCSKQQVYRLLDEAGLIKTKRKARSDKGNSQITKDQAELIGGMILVATRANGKRILSVKDAAEILKAQGKLPDLSVSAILRALKMYHCHPDQLTTPTAHVSKQSLHPNHVWELDPSVCVLFYLKKGGLAVMEEKEFYKNKPANVAKVSDKRVMRYVITDHYSSNVYVQYVMGAESAENLTKVFLSAIQKRSHQDPLHGVPFYLIMDKGSANLSGLFLNLLERLGVTAIPHTAGNSRAKGQVEKHNDIVERKFESRLTFISIDSLEQLNQACTSWRNSFNATAIHTRTKKTRNAVWGKITEEQLRIAPSLEVCHELVTTKPVQKDVRGDLTVTHTVKDYPNQAYDLSHIKGIYPKAKVSVVVNPYRAPAVDITLVDDFIGDDTVYTVMPIQTAGDGGFRVDAPIIGEEIKAMPQSTADANRKTMLKQAYDANTEAEVDKARKQRKPAYEGQINIMADVEAVDVPTYMPKRGEQLDVSEHITSREVKPLTHVEAAMQLRGLLGEQWTAQHFQDLQQQYPKGVPVKAIDDIAQRINTGKGISFLTLDTDKKAVNH